ncbi:beta-galactosidase [Allostreptomyces psammosilenae]|uniref:Beta-galactosidase n=1 Tax=Allostreptomyces psammosilenae TaxID=1892865 RepID=A0A852ZRK7_9ACTN|nr:beta-galactosidase [Allostreptomyces psammosilenae]NYI04415.1 beta-galactosidase [Allostreptomyces psammosilenae]
MPDLSDATRGRVLYGGDYNPEQWPEEVWAEDAALMRRAGVTLATVGVFSWARIEPRPGARDFDWLDRVLDLLHDAGVGVCLATPTASPPPWLGHRHPDTLPVDDAGTPLTYGSRNQWCPSAPEYRRHSLALVADLAERYAGHPALRLWHVGNETGPTCHCEHTATAFRHWLRARHGTLERLNESWATAFWSQRYDSWEEITTPRRAPYLHNPTQLLDFRRFTSDVLLDQFRAERDLLRQATPHVPVTTNFIHLWDQVDQWAWAAEEDAAAIDVYTDPEDPARHVESALAYDLARSLRDGAPWILMEQAVGGVNWRERNTVKTPARMRLDSLQAVARGADTVAFFQWRASRAGAEKFHSGMLPHAGPDTRAFRQVCRLGDELGRLGPAVAGSRVPAEIGLLWDWHNVWALRQKAHPRQDLDPAELLREYHRTLWQAGHTADLLPPGSDRLDRYRLLVVPNLYLVTDADAERLVRYVAEGGTLLMGFFSGVVDEHDHIRLGGHPAPFRDLLGVTGEEFRPLAPDAGPRVSSALLGDFRAAYWMETLRTTGAEAVATVEPTLPPGPGVDPEDAGMPVITRHSHGAGTAWYVATRLDDPTRARLLTRVADDAGLRPAPLAAPVAGVEAVRRGEVLFLLNHGGQPVTVPLPEGYAAGSVDLLTGTPHRQAVELPAEDALALLPGDRLPGRGSAADARQG